MYLYSDFKKYIYVKWSIEHKMFCVQGICLLKSENLKVSILVLVFFVDFLSIEG